MTSPGKVHLASGAAILMLVATLATGCSDTPPPEMQADLYQQAIDELPEDARFFPTTEPVDTDFVTLTSIDGAELMAVQHSDVNVVICASAPCTDGAETLRTFEFNGHEYVIQYAALGQITQDAPALNPQVAQYWMSATFTSERPEWLDMNLYPGR